MGWRNCNCLETAVGCIMRKGERVLQGFEQRLVKVLVQSHLDPECQRIDPSLQVVKRFRGVLSQI